MPVSRRRFLKHGIFATACAALPLPAFSGVHSSTGEFGAANNATNATAQGHIFGKVLGLGRDSFSSVIGSAFKVSVNSQPVWLRLVAVNDLPALLPVNPASMAVPPKSSTPIPTTGFMVSFSGPGTTLSQGTYLFEHDSLGQFNLFIVPGHGGLGTYTAIFNSLGSLAPAAVPVRPPTRLRPATGSGVPRSAGHSATQNTGGSEGSGRPAQEPEEPIFRNSLKPQMPE